MHRVRIVPGSEQGALITLLPSEAHYVAHVLRKQCGDEIEAFDGVARAYRVRLTLVSPPTVCGQIIAAHAEVPPVSVPLVLGQALPRGNRMELVVEKCSELGLTTLVPLCTERTVVQLSRQATPHKLARWRRLAEAAARQCGRHTLLDIRTPMSLQECCAAYQQSAVKLLCWEEETAQGLRPLLEAAQEHQPVIVLVGPEGGWTEQEVCMARAHGFVTVSLGAHVLRTETAAIAVTAIIQHGLGAMEPQKDSL